MNTRIIATRLTVLGTLAFGASLNAFAAGDGNGWYGTANVGRSNVQSNNVDGALGNQGIAASSSVEKHDTNYSLGVGYQFNRNFAVEGGYTNLGKFDVNSSISSPSSDSAHGQYKIDGWNATAVGILPLDKGFSAYGKAGVFVANNKLDLSSDTGATAVSGAKKTSITPTYGLGLSYKITDNVTGRAEWNHYQDVGNDSTGKLDLNTYTLGVAMHF